MTEKKSNLLIHTATKSYCWNIKDSYIFENSFNANNVLQFFHIDLHRLL